MAGEQTPQGRNPDRPGEPDSGTPKDGESISDLPNQRSGGDSDPVSASAAAVAAVSAVSAAIAAAAASKAPRSSAKPPIAIEGYVRAPGRDIAGLTRAHHDEPEEVAATSFEPPNPTMDEADPHSRYKRPAGAPAFAAAPLPPVPDVPGIIRAHRDEADSLEKPGRPAPLFSNEGIVRESQARPGNRVVGSIAGFFGALLDAGSALGHSIGSHSPGTKTAIASPVLSPVEPGSPDFDRLGNPRLLGRRRRRTAGAMLLGGLAAVVVLGLALSTILLPTPENNGFPTSPGASRNPVDNWNGQLDSNTTADPNALPSGLAIGDDPLASGATRRPGAAVATTPPVPSGSFCWTMPAPSATATASPSSTGPKASASGSRSPGPSSSASVTPQPSPTPIKTTCPTPTPSHIATPQPTPTLVPTPTPIPTPSPTPEMVALIYSATPPAASPGNGYFIVGSLPGAKCRLWRLPVASDNQTRRSGEFETKAVDDGWAYILWGAGWPISNVTVTVYATCTAAAPDGRTATSDQVSVAWPPNATPTPPPTATQTLPSVGP